MKITEYSPKQKIEITQNKIVSLAKNNQIFIKIKLILFIKIFLY